jgi:DNA-binding LytR/AlgR family response regulator
MMERCDVLIVEDEMVIAEAIADILKHTGYKHICISESVEDAMNTIEACRPNIVLTDINLGKEKTGIDLGYQLLHRYKIPFIYITSLTSPEIVGKAKHTRPSAYIVKPFRNDDLLIAIELALFNSNNRFTPIEDEQCLTIKEGKAMTHLPLRNIMWIETTGAYTTINVPNGKKRVFRLSMNEVENQVVHKAFLRIHDGYMINCSYITETHPNSIVVSGTELPVGTNYQARVHSYFSC